MLQPSRSTSADGTAGRRTWANGSALRSRWSRAASAAPRRRSRAISSAGADPITLAILRWGIGFLCVLPAALLLKARWPQRRDWPAVAALGLLLLRRVLRPLQHRDRRTRPRRAPASRWRRCRCTPWWSAPARHRAVDEAEDARRLHRGARRRRSARLGTFGRAARRMARRIDHDRRRAVHGLLQRLVPPVHPALQRARLSHRRHGDGRRRADPGRVVHRQRRGVEPFGTPQWIAGIYLGVGGGALAFILWVLALERATPTRVANTMTVNPIAAGLLATQLVGEPITPNLVLGLIAVFAGIWIATSEIKRP